MADQKKSPDKNDLVDISSSAEMNKVYKNSPSGGAKSKKRRAAFAFRVVILVLSIIMLAGGSVIIYGYGMLDTLNFKEVVSAPAPTGESDDSSVKVKQTGSSLLQSDEVLNILLFGQDAKGDGQTYGRSDTTILLSVDNVNKKLKLTSFQRDTYVSIPGYGDNKINAAFTFGGEGLSIKTIEANFGIKVDKYATVDFDSFRKIIKVLGGVDIELNIEEIEYINAQIDVNNQLDRTSFLEYDPYKEQQVVHLDGYQALWYARDRGEMNLGGNPNYSFSGDDWDRTSRQRKLLETIIKDLRTKASLADLIGIINEVGPLVTTNLKKEDITFLASNIMTYIKYDMEQLSLPTTGTWRYGRTDDGQSVIVIDDWDGARYDLASFIYESSVVRDSNTNN